LVTQRILPTASSLPHEKTAKNKAVTGPVPNDTAISGSRLAAKGYLAS
jgi:hypothetical protein